ncbi:ABC transporter permease [Ruminococcus sp. OA3]|uniref:ABC transporter permease n=1 Tax=Ruminococcus sp. OA3 TaxID=2914164 RepID=UPI001F059BDE|nr:ABC transporter permease [Ruminococcus sp. OA3]MCH1983855.1 ABC transporter permease [Ruminococcus sp. OA3]
MRTGEKIVCLAQDSRTMSERCILLSLRNPDAFLTGIGTPILMMLLFVCVLGGAMKTGSANYVDYLVPGIILQCIGQCGCTTAVSVNIDLKGGMVDRFRSMPVAASSVLAGHVFAAMVRNIITAVLVFGMAFLIGFRPSAGGAQWLIVAGILLLFMAAMTWISMILGLIAGGAESANGISAVIMFLPYLSSGFAPTETMPAALRFFAERQPMTPIAESIRSLLINAELDACFLPAVLWCVGLLIAAHAGAVMIYKKKTKR